MEQNKPQHEEKEVELVPIFVWIGRGISSCFNGIGRFFASLGHLFLLFLIFLQRNLLLIVGITILGGALGWYLNQDSKNLYTTEMRVQPNFKSTEHLIAKVSSYQSLINEKDVAKLGKELGITSSMAATITSINIEPYYNEIELLKEYDDFARRSDTMALKDLTFEGYKAAKRDFDYEYQSITARGSNTIVLNKTMDKLVALDQTTAIAAAKRTSLETAEYKLAAMEMQVRNLDTLMISLQKAVKDSGSNQAIPTNNIYLNDQQESSTMFTSIFEEKQKMLNRIDLTKKQYYDYQNVINVISKYTQKGSIFKQHLVLKGALLFFLVGLIVAAAPKLWRFLKEYEEKTNQ
jgi:hypothetical protein